MNRTETTPADLLAAKRINWRALEQLGVKPATVYAEAVAAGDWKLAALARKAGERSALRAIKAGRLDAWLAAA